MIELHHGDCLEVMSNIEDNSIDLVLTDPPYGTTANKWDAVIEFKKMWINLHRVIKKDSAILLFSAEPFGSALRMSNIKNFKYDWVWVKDNGTGFLSAKFQPLKNNEQINVFCYGTARYYPQMRTGYKPYFCKSGKRGENYNESNGDRYPLNTLSFCRDLEKKHPTQKPVDLLEYLIKTYTLEGETVLDFTMGSGSTGVAAKKLKRNFIGIEKDENYFQIAKKRIANGESCYQQELL